MLNLLILATGYIIGIAVALQMECKLLKEELEWK